MKKKTFKIITIVIVLLLSLVIFFKVSNNSIISNASTQIKETRSYSFRNKSLLTEHFNKHGKDLGYQNINDYQKGANKVINNTNSLHKVEKEDGDDLFYLETTNEYVVLSKDGYIRTYFKPDAGKAYFDRK